jgi:hypothetical protein
LSNRGHKEGRFDRIATVYADFVGQFLEDGLDAHGSAIVSIEPELGLIKAALLYGDEVTLLSPVTTMFLGVEQWGCFSMIEQLELIRKVAPYMTDHNLAVVSESADKIESILRGGGHHNRLLRAQLMRKFKPTQESTVRELEAISEKAVTGPRFPVHRV